MASCCLHLTGAKNVPAGADSNSPITIGLIRRGYSFPKWLSSRRPCRFGKRVSETRAAGIEEEKRMQAAPASSRILRFLREACRDGRVVLLLPHAIDCAPPAEPPVTTEQLIAAA